MKKEISLGQLITAALGVLMAVITAWISLKERISELETTNKFQDSRIESVQLETKSNTYETRTKLDALQQSVNEIKILLERKQDRR